MHAAAPWICIAHGFTKFLLRVTFDSLLAASADAVDVEEAVKLLREHGVHPPVLLRFPDIVSHRLRKLQVQAAFWPPDSCVRSTHIVSPAHICDA